MTLSLNSLSNERSNSTVDVDSDSVMRDINVTTTGYSTSLESSTSLDLTTRSRTSGENVSSHCKILANAAPKFALAPRWSNIPETLLFNLFLGLILYTIFSFLSRRAWSRRSLMKEFVECGIIEFLYGYRDPARWVAMPRFEFIHRCKRHHEHDLNFPYLFISPRLIAYDPNNILRKDINTKFERHQRQRLGETLVESAVNNKSLPKGKSGELTSSKGTIDVVDSKIASPEDSPESPPESTSSSESLYHHLLERRHHRQLLAATNSIRPGALVSSDGSAPSSSNPCPSGVVGTEISDRPAESLVPNSEEKLQPQAQRRFLSKGGFSGPRFQSFLAAGRMAGLNQVPSERHLEHIRSRAGLAGLASSSVRARAGLNLPLTSDPILSPPLAAKLEGATVAGHLDSSSRPEKSELLPTTTPTPTPPPAPPPPPPSSSTSGEQVVKPLESSKRSKLLLEDADDQSNPNVEDLHVIISHLERANWLTRKLNKLFNRFSDITDIDLIYCKGIDAYEYLLFQRHMILLLVVMNLCCLCLILPIHLMGDNLQDRAIGFKHTTIINLSSSTMLYWAHIMSSLIILITAITLLASYKAATITKDDILVSRRTLLVGRLGNELRSSKHKLQSLFTEFFPDSQIEAIQYVYDTSKLELLQQCLETVIVAREYCDLYRVKRQQRGLQGDQATNFLVKPIGINEGRLCNGMCRLCSCCFVCLCYWPCVNKVNGSSYYALKEKIYRAEIEEECRRLVNLPFEAAFITFASHRQTSRVYQALIKRFNFSQNFDLNQPAKSHSSPFYLPNIASKSPMASKSLIGRESTSGSPTKRDRKKSHRRQQFMAENISSSKTSDSLDKNKTTANSLEAANRQLKPNSPGYHQTSPVSPNNVIADRRKRFDQLKHLTVRYAPHPDNVQYRDLLLDSTAGFITQLMLNLLMIVIFLFLSTPTVVFKYLSHIEADKMIKGELPKMLVNSSLANYALVLLQVLATVMLPTFVQLISQSIPHNDSASKNHSIMWKVFLFTMLMVVVLPSFGLTTSTGLIMAFLDRNTDIDMRCVFPTDNGAFFINYIISSSIVSPFMELLKPSDIFIYFFIRATGRSKADFEEGRQLLSKEFPIGLQYTKFLLNLAVVFCYTISCPLIAPFGLMYMLIKHQVDKYNLYYIYYTSKVDRQTQRTVEVFIRLALVLMLLQSSLAISFNTGIGYFALISQILLWFAVATFLNNCLFDCTSSTVSWQKKIRFQREFCACFYLPRVFEDLLKENALPSDCIRFLTLLSCISILILMNMLTIKVMLASPFELITKNNGKSNAFDSAYIELLMKETSNRPSPAMMPQILGWPMTGATITDTSNKTESLDQFMGPEGKLNCIYRTFDVSLSFVPLKGECPTVQNFWKSKEMSGISLNYTYYVHPNGSNNNKILYKVITPLDSVVNQLNFTSSQPATGPSTLLELRFLDPYIMNDNQKRQVNHLVIQNLFLGFNSYGLGGFNYVYSGYSLRELTELRTILLIYDLDIIGQNDSSEVKKWSDSICYVRRKTFQSNYPSDISPYYFPKLTHYTVRFTGSIILDNPIQLSQPPASNIKSSVNQTLEVTFESLRSNANLLCEKGSFNIQRVQSTSGSLVIRFRNLFFGDLIKRTRQPLTSQLFSVPFYDCFDLDASQLKDKESSIRIELDFERFFSQNSNTSERQLESLGRLLQMGFQLAHIRTQPLIDLNEFTDHRSRHTFSVFCNEQPVCNIFKFSHLFHRLEAYCMYGDRPESVSRIPHSKKSYFSKCITESANSTNKTPLPAIITIGPIDEASDLVEAVEPDKMDTYIRILAFVLLGIGLLFIITCCLMGALGVSNMKRRSLIRAPHRKPIEPAEGSL